MVGGPIGTYVGYVIGGSIGAVVVGGTAVALAEKVKSALEWGKPYYSLYLIDYNSETIKNYCDDIETIS